MYYMEKVLRFVIYKRRKFSSGEVSDYNLYASFDNIDDANDQLDTLNFDMPDWEEYKVVDNGRQTEVKRFAML
tara:strand:+ start:918 stop:1136 length:219 start_codon:yes stop_codon:yes gene_type:complete